MIFATEKPRNALLTKGFVIAARKTRRRQIGKNWICGRPGTKDAEALIFELGKYGTSIAASKFCDLSGFEDPKQWDDEIKRLNHGYPEEIWFYLVVILPPASDKKSTRE